MEMQVPVRDRRHVPRQSADGGSSFARHGSQPGGDHRSPQVETQHCIHTFRYQTMCQKELKIIVCTLNRSELTGPAAGSRPRRSTVGLIPFLLLIAHDSRFSMLISIMLLFLLGCDSRSRLTLMRHWLRRKGLAMLAVASSPRAPSQGSTS